MSQRLAAAIAASGLVGAVPAQVPDPIIVTASRVATPVSEVARATTIVDAQSIRERHLRTLDEALQAVPGLQVVRSGGPGQQTSVFVRGTESNHVLVLLDGMEIADPGNPSGGFDFASLDLANVERIEVVRGPNSVLYGSDAIGGTVNIITRGGKRRGASVTLEGGSFDTFNQRAALGGGNWGMNLSHRKTHGYSVTAPRLQSPPVDDDGNESWTLSARGERQLATRTRGELFGQYVDDRTEVDLGSGEDPDAFLDTRRLYLRGALHHDWGHDRFATAATLTHTRDRRRTRNDRQDPLGTFQDQTYESDKTKFDIKTDYLALREHRLSLGASVEREAVDTSGLSDFGGFVIVEDTAADATSRALYFQDQFAVGSNLFGTLGVRLDDHEAFGTFETWQLAPAYRLPGGATTLRGSIGTAFRAPALYELYGRQPNSFGGSYVGNPDLRPERSLGWDLGVDHGLGDTRFSATWYRQKIDDLIALVYRFPDSTSVNQDSAETEGWEVRIDRQWSETWSAGLDYTYTDAVDGEGERLLRRPRHKVDLGLRCATAGGGVVRLAAQYLADQVDISRTTGARVDMPDYLVVNLAAEYPISRGWTVIARIDNLFDEEYEPANGFQGTPLSGYLGIRYAGRD